MKKIAFIDDYVENPGKLPTKYRNDFIDDDVEHSTRYKEDMKIISELRKNYDVEVYSNLWYARDEILKNNEKPDYIITNVPPYNPRENPTSSLFESYKRSLHCLKTLDKFLDAKIIVFSGAPERIFNEIKKQGISLFLRRSVIDLVEDNIEKLLELIK